MQRPEVWQDLAACNNVAPVIFEIIDEDHPSGVGLSHNEKVALTNDNFEVAEELCLNCPVMDACWADATQDDREWSYRAGRYPSRFTGKMRGRPKGSHAPGYVTEKRCNRGHVRLATEPKCNVCANISKKERKIKAEKLSVDRAMKRL